jgi:hypothetical protein
MRRFWKKILVLNSNLKAIEIYLFNFKISAETNSQNRPQNEISAVCGSDGSVYANLCFLVSCTLKPVPCQFFDIHFVDFCRLVLATYKVINIYIGIVSKSLGMVTFT